MRKNGKLTKIIIVAVCSFWACYLFGFSLECAFKGGFSARYLASKETLLLSFLLLAIEGVLVLVYYYRHYWLLHTKNFLKGKKGDLHLDANLEQAHFQSQEELDANFKTYKYSELGAISNPGTPIMAKEGASGLEVTFTKTAHALVIGTTGSGKTTTFVSPMIQILSSTATKPSMFISDPKGELLADHRKALEDRGYEVKVLDLRNPYNSVRWNPLEKPYLEYQKAITIDDELIDDEERECYSFEGIDYKEKEDAESAMQVRKQQLLDDVYEDLNDVCTVLCPVTNHEEPMWESGAKNFVLSIALAMLEDSADPRFGLKKEKYNFFSLMKVATSTDDDCKDLIEYFKHRDPLSRAVSLSKQVLDASDKTRGSYLSTTFDKLSMFADQSLCALTSENEIEFGSMGERPIALFLQIPDEKETRHTLASMVILQAYKELVYRANTYDSLCLPKPVYFILDEFGNLPKIHKMEQMVTVGRSRNIWLNLVVQSYSQLAKVYDEKAADIIKSNCNIQVFIGTSDLKTIEDFSKRCGNYSMVQRSVGFNSVKGEDVSSNSTIKERPLIYPSELQTLNRPGDMGHAIVTVFGYQPIKSTFAPSFLCDEYSMARSKPSLKAGRWFDESRAFYDLRKRNSLIFSGEPAEKKKSEAPVPKKEAMSKMMMEQIWWKTAPWVKGVLTDGEIASLQKSIMVRFDPGSAIAILKKAINEADKKCLLEESQNIQGIVAKIIEAEEKDSRGPMAANK